MPETLQSLQEKSTAITKKIDSLKKQIATNKQKRAELKARVEKDHKHTNGINQQLEEEQNRLTMRANIIKTQWHAVEKKIERHEQSARQAYNIYQTHRKEVDRYVSEFNALNSDRTAFRQDVIKFRQSRSSTHGDAKRLEARSQALQKKDARLEAWAERLKGPEQDYTTKREALEKTKRSLNDETARFKLKTQQHKASQASLDQRGDDCLALARKHAEQHHRLLDQTPGPVEPLEEELKKLTGERGGIDAQIDELKNAAKNKQRVTVKAGTYKTAFNLAGGEERTLMASKPIPIGNNGKLQFSLVDNQGVCHGKAVLDTKTGKIEANINGGYTIKTNLANYQVADKLGERSVTLEGPTFIADANASFKVDPKNEINASFGATLGATAAQIQAKAASPELCVMGLCFQVSGEAAKNVGLKGTVGGAAKVNPKSLKIKISGKLGSTVGVGGEAQGDFSVALDKGVFDRARKNAGAPGGPLSESLEKVTAQIKQLKMQKSNSFFVKMRIAALESTKMEIMKEKARGAGNAALLHVNPSEGAAKAGP
jgi:peptidoglycan hydrolase CwlO-like protein